MLRFALPLLGYLAVLPAHSAPAPWLLWESQTSAHRMCAQTSPGAAWLKVSGPYRNAACRAVPPHPGR